MRNDRLAYVMCGALLALGACGDDDSVADAGRVIDAAPPTGTFSLAWTLSDGTTIVPCADIGAVTVSVQIIPQGAFSGSAESFSCSSAAATSGGFEPGLYDVQIDLRASFGRSLLSTPIKINGFEIKANTDTPLPTQAFEVAPAGTYTFSVSSGANNCMALIDGGAGMVGFDFVAKTSGGVCLETDFVVADGSETGGTYPSSCSGAATTFPCIGGDQLITVGLPSGAWALEITGQKEGPLDCYSRVANFNVPGGGLSTTGGLLQLNLEYSEACDPNYVPPDAGIEVDAGVSDAGIDAAI